MSETLQPPRIVRLKIGYGNSEITIKQSRGIYAGAYCYEITARKYDGEILLSYESPYCYKDAASADVIGRNLLYCLKDIQDKNIAADIKDAIKQVEGKLTSENLP